MIKKLWDEYLLYKKLKYVHEMHMDEHLDKNETLGKPQNNSVFAISQNYAETNPVWQFIKNIQANEKTVPCRDKTIVAVLTHKPTGQKFYGTNGIKRDVGYCPRNESNHERFNR